jgi:hypothetical protein
MRDGFLGYFFVVHGAVDLAADGEKVVAIEERGAAKVLSAKELTIATRRGAEVLLVEVPR